MSEKPICKQCRNCYCKKFNGKHYYCAPKSKSNALYKVKGNQDACDKFLRR